MLERAGSPGIRPKKECIKSCETHFANTLNLNDKGPSMQWVCFPKVLWPFNYMTLTQNFFECYLLFDHYCLTMIDELYIYTLYSYANKPNKCSLRNSLLALLLWEISHFSSPSRSCLGRLIFIRGRGGPWGWRPPTIDMISVGILSVIRQRTLGSWHLLGTLTLENAEINPPRHRKAQKCKRLQRNWVKNSVFPPLIPHPLHAPHL